MLRSHNIDQDIREQYIGQDCDKYKGLLKLRYPVKHGTFQNDQDILTLFNYIYTKLDINSEEIKDHPVLLTEPLLNPYSNREAIATALFDGLGVPALFFASQPILSLFSTSNTSGVILESGAEVTQSCAIYEGYSIPNSYLRYDYGGRNVTDFLQRLLKYSGYSFNTTAELNIVEKMKEKHCYFCGYQQIDKGSTYQDASVSQFVLPDNTVINLKDEKIIAPEILFDPSMVGLECMSFSEMVLASINKVDIDLRSTLTCKILFAGGNTLFKGIKEKFLLDFKSKKANAKFGFYIPTNRIYACWLGANVISTLEIFKKMWIAKSDWLEKGKKVLHTKTI